MYPSTKGLSTLPEIVVEPVVALPKVGAYLEDIVQEDPAAKLAGQLCEVVNGPLVLIVLNTKGALPTLAKVAVWIGLVAPAAIVAKLKLAGVNVSAGTGAAAPVPTKGTSTIAVALLLCIASVPALDPSEAGWKTTFIWQDCPPLKLAPTQSDVLEKLPLRVTSEIAKVPLPVFVTVTGTGAL